MRKRSKMTQSNANDSTGERRVTIPFPEPELEAVEEFRKADARPSEANAIRALVLLGLDSWRQKGRPKGHRLTPQPVNAA